jgi:hypothetical protein
MHINVALSLESPRCRKCPPTPPARDDRYCPYSSMSSDRSVSISDIGVCATATAAIEIGCVSARREGTLDKRNWNSHRGLRGQSFARRTAFQSAQT